MVVTRNLSSMLPRVYIRGGVQFRILSVLSRLIKRYGTSSGLVMELRRIISSSKWANAWLEVQEDEYEWYFIKKYVFTDFFTDVTHDATNNQ